MAATSIGVIIHYAGSRPDLPSQGIWVVLLAGFLLFSFGSTAATGLEISATLEALDDSAQFYFPVRAFGSLGYVAAGVTLSLLLENMLGTPYFIAGAGFALLALWRMSSGAEASRASDSVLEQRPGIFEPVRQVGAPVLLLAAAMATLPKGLDTWGPLFLRKMNCSYPELIFVSAQMSEALVLAALPFVLPRVRSTWLLLAGPIGWIGLYGFMFLGARQQNPITVAIGLAAFEWVNCAFQAGLQRNLADRFRAASTHGTAQVALLAAFASGQFAGTLAWAMLVTSARPAGSATWTTVWLCGMALAALVLPLALWVWRREAPRRDVRLPRQPGQLR